MLYYEIVVIDKPRHRTSSFIGESISVKDNYIYVKSEKYGNISFAYEDKDTVIIKMIDLKDE